jgi:co-chaperonin GroES (HSP10)
MTDLTDENGKVINLGTTTGTNLTLEQIMERQREEERKQALAFQAAATFRCNRGTLVIFEKSQGETRNDSLIVNIDASNAKIFRTGVIVAIGETSNKDYPLIFKVGDTVMVDRNVNCVPINLNGVSLFLTSINSVAGALG